MTQHDDNAPETAGSDNNTPPQEFRSGFVAIMGRPNAGKSTLLNKLIGQKVAIVSNKPQTTRDRIAGILTTDTYQVVFVDMPGVIEANDRFNEILMYRVGQAIEDVDVLYHLIDATDIPKELDPATAATLKAAGKCTKFFVLNKIDQAAKAEIPAWAGDQNYTDGFRVSAITGKGVPKLLEATLKYLKPGPHYYDSEQVTDVDERFLASEIVREKVFRHFGAEVPYSVFTETDAFEERENKDFIRVTIYVERDSQKGILIGEGGRMLKELGREARLEIEKAIDRPCFLELWVKVRKNWHKNDLELGHFGFKKPRKKK